MAFSGFKKQFNKANQYMNEKIGGAEGTKLDDDFMEMEKRTDITVELVDELQIKTKEYLQPNPTVRAKMQAVKSISKLSGQAKASTYPQPEGVLGETMSNFGRKLGEDSIYAAALIETGEAFKLMADAKYSLDDNVKQNFLEPLHQLQHKDLKEVMHHRKKLQGRRLDFDCKRRRQTKGNAKSPYGSPIHLSANQYSNDDDIKVSEDKFAESLHLAQMGMWNLLENDCEQVNQMASFVECLVDYHRQCVSILDNLNETLQEKREEANNKPRREFVPKTVHDLQLHLDVHDHENHRDGQTPSKSPMASPSHRPNDQSWFPGTGNQNQNQLQKSVASTPVESPMKSSPAARSPSGPSCKAVYDFDAENPGELGFKEGEIIHLNSRIDDNWFEGSIHGKTGFFPQTYVEVLVPLP